MKGSVLFWQKIEKKLTKYFGFPDKVAYPPPVFHDFDDFCENTKKSKKIKKSSHLLTEKKMKIRGG